MPQLLNKWAELVRAQFRAGLACGTRRNVSAGVGSAVFGMVLAMVNYPVQLHYLGFERYAVWLILITPITLVQLSSLGLGPAVSTLVAEAWGRRDLPIVRSHLAGSILLMLAFGGTLALASILHASFFADLFRIPPVHRAAFCAYLPRVMLLVIYGLVVECFTCTLGGIGRFDLAVANSMTAQIMAFGLALLMLGRGLKLEALWTSQLVSYGIMHVLAIYHLRHLLRDGGWAQFHLDRRGMWRLLRTSNWLLGCSAVSLFVGPLNKLILARYAGMAAIPAFDIAYVCSMRLRNVVEYGLRAILIRLGEISGTQGADRRAAMSALRQKSHWFAVSFGSVAYLLFLAAAVPLLRMWLQSAYLPSMIPPLRLLLLASWIAVLSLPLSYLLIAVNKVVVCFVASCVMLGVHLCATAATVLLRGGISGLHLAACLMLGTLASALFLRRAAAAYR